MKEKPDFSKCIDPEFAKIEYEYKQILLDRCRKNPFLEQYKRLDKIEKQLHDLQRSLRNAATGKGRRIR